MARHRLHGTWSIFGATSLGGFHEGQILLRLTPAQRPMNRVKSRSLEQIAHTGLQLARFGVRNATMPTLEQLQQRKQELEEKLHAGDLAVEVTLLQIDRAISSRVRKVQHSQLRLEAVKQAVSVGMDKDQARRLNNKAAAKNLAELRAKRLLNRF